MRKAFTLIELLVVISIIALLIAILLPALASANRAARTTQCLANTRSLGQAYYSYAADNNGAFMPYVNNALKRPLWTGTLREYVGESLRRNSKNVPIGYYDASFCPEAPQDRPDEQIAQLSAGTVGSATKPWYHAWHQTVDGGVYGGSYGMNGYIYATKDWRNKNPRYPDFVDKVHDASRMPAFADANWIDGWPNATDPKPPRFDNLPGSMDPHMLRFAIDRHELQQNVSFVDGHAETISVEELWELEWHNDDYTYPPN